MKAVPKFALLLSVAVMACAAFAGAAQAQVDINPDETDIIGTAPSPTLDFEGTQVQCDTGTATGRTGTDADFVNVALEFFGNYNIAGLGADVTCSDAVDAPDGELNEIGTARLQATDATNNLGIVDRLNTGFLCEVVVLGVCTVSVSEQELPISGGADQANLLNEGSNGDEAIDADVDVIAENDNPLCGPTPSGVGNFTGVYDLGVTPVSFD
jgi:hypothetical protein